MQEERSAGPHSYLAVHLVLLAAGALGIVALIFFGVKRFTGDKKLESCSARMERVASAVHAYARDHEGRYPDSLEQVASGEDLRCSLCGDDIGAAHYRYEKGPTSFTIECRYRAHSALGQKFPRYQSQ